MWTHDDMQGIARLTMDDIRASLRPGQTLQQVRDLGEQTLKRLGADSFWYWNIGAFVFAGTDTTLSISGRDYRTPEYLLGENELITVDLSPQRGTAWADFARTLVLENGEPLQNPLDTSNAEWRDGLSAELALHSKLLETATPDMTFEQLAELMNRDVLNLGYENLDFLGNLGHSIAERSEDRVYIEPGNQARLDSVTLFTFEPHIRRPDGAYGYKHENIYRFQNGRLEAI